MHVFINEILAKTILVIRPGDMTPRDWGGDVPLRTDWPWRCVREGRGSRLGGGGAGRGGRGRLPRWRCCYSPLWRAGCQCWVHYFCCPHSIIYLSFTVSILCSLFIFFIRAFILPWLYHTVLPVYIFSMRSFIFALCKDFYTFFSIRSFISAILCGGVWTSHWETFW